MLISLNFGRKPFEESEKSDQASDVVAFHKVFRKSLTYDRVRIEVTLHICD